MAMGKWRGLVGRQLRARDRPPHRGSRDHARRVPRIDVVRRISDEQRFGWRISELVEGYSHGKRIRLVDVARIVADRHLYVVVRADELEPAIHHRVALAGHDAHRMATLKQ